MSDLAIRVEGLGKEFHIGALQTDRYRTFGDALVEAITTPVRRARLLLSGRATGAAELDQSLWALRDIEFEVKPGEVVGVIGRNGAGKSTLLKILSRITEPTTGFAEIHGRVGSLLEVGTGFHPELTGRENVFLNGAILGMSRAEIRAKFDEIVAFSEIEKFIDTPVKHYSTGMGLRLAFAVAAHLDPEILIVDEVLAVGDASFQRKCLGKMGEVAHQGRTVLMVSHNMSAITQLCERTLLLDGGELVMDGPSSEIVSSYLSADGAVASRWSRADHPDESDEKRDLVMDSVEIRAADASATDVVAFEDSFTVEIRYTVRQSMSGIAVLFGVIDQKGDVVWSSWDTDSTDWSEKLRTPGSYLSRCTVPPHLLRPGRYYLNVAAHVPGVRMLDTRKQAVGFDVSTVGYGFTHKRPGVVTPQLEWDVSRNGG
ncbi:MAG: ABC transporter ATP-binding protein [Gemmatimonadota bacterium]